MGDKPSFSTKSWRTYRQKSLGDKRPLAWLGEEGSVHE